MFTKKGTAQIIDLGLSKTKSSSRSSFSLKAGDGTFPYMAPKLLQGIKIDYRVDTYAYGITVAELHAPFHGLAKENVRAAVLKGDRPPF